MRNERNKCGFCLWGLLVFLTAWIVLPSLTHAIIADDYEDDDQFFRAFFISTKRDSPSQRHNFHDAGDEDWIKFYARAGSPYHIEVGNLGSRCDVVIELYDSDGMTLLATVDEGAGGASETLAWTVPTGNPYYGGYYARIRHFDSTISGDDTGYDLKVFSPTGDGDDFITVRTDRTDVEVMANPTTLIYLNCKVEVGWKTWVFIEIPELFPSALFVRPSDSYCERKGRYIALFSLNGKPVSDAEELYFSNSCQTSFIDFGKNDFFGALEKPSDLNIIVKKGEITNFGSPIQTIRIRKEELRIDRGGQD